MAIVLFQEFRGRFSKMTSSLFSFQRRFRVLVTVQVAFKSGRVTGCTFCLVSSSCLIIYFKNFSVRSYISNSSVIFSPFMRLSKTSMSMRTLSGTHLQQLAFFPIGIQAGRAKLTASAMLKPELNPLWQAEARAMTNSRSCWTNLRILIPFLRSMCGSIRVVLCRRNSEHSQQRSLKKLFDRFSKSSLLSKSIEYQNLGLPL